jgi:hypothetical protein
MLTVRIDRYVLDTLMPDLVLHDHQPSAFLVYLQLSYRARRARVRMSHQSMADATGLSKSAVQAALRSLLRRRLVRVTRETATAVPEYTVLRPWRRSGASRPGRESTNDS